MEESCMTTLSYSPMDWISRKKNPHTTYNDAEINDIDIMSRTLGTYSFVWVLIPPQETTHGHQIPTNQRNIPYEREDP
jgi:hypothetical protein